MFAAEIPKRRVEDLRSSRWRWDLNEVFVKINGVTHYLWRTVDQEGEVLEGFVSKKRDRKAALKFLRKNMRQPSHPLVLVTDKLRSYGSALNDLGRIDERETGSWLNNRAENPHQPFRRRARAMLRFRRMRSLKSFVGVDSSIHNHVNGERALSSRDNFEASRAAALAEWRTLRGLTPSGFGQTETGSHWSDTTQYGSLRKQRSERRTPPIWG